MIQELINVNVRLTLVVYQAIFRLLPNQTKPIIPLGKVKLREICFEKRFLMCYHEAIILKLLTYFKIILNRSTCEQ